MTSKKNAGWIGAIVAATIMISGVASAKDNTKEIEAAKNAGVIMGSTSGALIGGGLGMMGGPVGGAIGSVVGGAAGGLIINQLNRGWGGGGSSEVRLQKRMIDEVGCGTVRIDC